MQARWRDFAGRTGPGRAVSLTDDSGYFWVCYGALSNVEYRITVVDTATGATRTYFNALHQFASRGDTAAFPDS